MFAAADVPSWVGIPTGVAGLGIPLYLWLTGRVMLRGDHDERMATAQQRIEAITADRDAWREAQREEARAVMEAQRATSALMDTTSISRDLLGALRDAVERR